MTFLLLWNREGRGGGLKGSGGGRYMCVYVEIAIKSFVLFWNLTVRIDCSVSDSCCCMPVHLLYRGRHCHLHCHGFYHRQRFELCHSPPPNPPNFLASRRDVHTALVRQGTTINRKLPTHGCSCRAGSHGSLLAEAADIYFRDDLVTEADAGCM